MVKTHKDFWEIVEATQEFISSHYAQLLYDSKQKEQLKPYIENFLYNQGYEVEGFTNTELTNKIFRELAEFSILTDYLVADYLEEININAWNDIALTYLDGSIHKAPVHFNSPAHAMSIVRRLLECSDTVIDDSSPMAQGHLPNNSRITVLKPPIVDEERAVSASIRILRPAKFDVNELVRTGMATSEIVDFLTLCMNYGVSTVISGKTSSGKTTLLNALLETVPNDKRIFTIESGARELYLVREQEGSIANNVVNTLSRPASDAKYEISQEDLVIASLRFNPDIVCIGEMRDVEAYSAVEASLTGHTVVSTIHSSTASVAHTRLALLCQKRFPIEFQTSLTQACLAFPLVIYTHLLENNERKIMDISECEILPNGECKYNPLYRYHITKNIFEDNQHIIEGHFERVNPISKSLAAKLLQFGAPMQEIAKYSK